MPSSNCLSDYACSFRVHGHMFCAPFLFWKVQVHVLHMIIMIFKIKAYLTNCIMFITCMYSSTVSWIFELHWLKLQHGLMETKLLWLLILTPYLSASEITVFRSELPMMLWCFYRELTFLCFIPFWVVLSGTTNSTR